MNVETKNSSLLGTSSGMGTGAAPDDKRAAAAQRIAVRRHRAFKVYVGVLAAVNAVIVAFWVALAIGGRLDLVKISVWPNQPPLPEGFFWPVFPIAICGFLVWMSARRAYPRDGYADEVIDQEIARHEVSHLPRSAPTPSSASSAPAGSPAVRPLPRTMPRGASIAPSSLQVQRRGFWIHLLVYVVVNAVLVASWALGGGGFFWPVFLMATWGIGVLVNAYLAYRPQS